MRHLGFILILLAALASAAEAQTAYTVTVNSQNAQQDIDLVRMAREECQRVVALGQAAPYGFAADCTGTPTQAGLELFMRQRLVNALQNARAKFLDLESHELRSKWPQLSQTERNTCKAACTLCVFE